MAGLLRRKRLRLLLEWVVVSDIEGVNGAEVWLFGSFLLGENRGLCYLGSKRRHFWRRFNREEDEVYD